MDREEGATSGVECPNLDTFIPGGRRDPCRRAPGCIGCQREYFSSLAYSTLMDDFELILENVALAKRRNITITYSRCTLLQDDKESK